MNALQGFLPQRFSFLYPSESKPQPVWTWFKWVVLTGLILRMAYAGYSDYVWHADEILQYLEQGHRLTFGYGLIPWEYRFGLRSWLLPGFVSSILSLSKVLGLDHPNSYIHLVRFVFVCISMGIPIGMYFFARSAFSEPAARIALVFGCFWYELVVMAHKSLTSTVATSLFFLALASATSRSPYRKVWFTGLLLSLVAMLRIQYVPLVGLLFVLVFLSSERNRKLHFTLSAVLGATLIGSVDAFTWGSWGFSLFQNFQLSFFLKVHQNFGASPWYEYGLNLFATSAGLLLLALILSVVFARRYLFVLLCAAAVLLPHTWIEHKEYRFIFVLAPLFLVLIADSIERLSQQRKRWQPLLLAIPLTISLAGLLQLLPQQKTVYPGSFFQQRENLQVYRYLSSQPDVSGVYDLVSWWAHSGGYYYLHKDVPLYFWRGFRRKRPNRNVHQYVSHIISPAKTPSFPGFKRLKRMGSLQVWKNKSQKPITRRWPGYSRHIIHPSIESDPRIKKFAP